MDFLQNTWDRWAYTPQYFERIVFDFFSTFHKFLLLFLDLYIFLGVELAENRHETAVDLRSRLNNALGDADKIDLRLVKGSLLDTKPWAGATMVFTNNLLFPDRLTLSMFTGDIFSYVLNHRTSCFA